MYGVMTLYQLSLLYYQMTTTSAVNRNLASVINNWNDSSKCFYELIKSHVFLLELLISFKIKDY